MDMQKNTDVKIEFFELDKEVSETKMDETYTVSMGAMSNAGSYHSLSNIVNLKLKDKNVKIVKEEEGVMLDAGDMSFYEYADTVKHTFYINNKKHEMTIKRGSISDYAISSNKLDLSPYTILELDELNILLNKDELSNKNLVDLEINLKLRQNMPNYLRNFTSFKDLQRKIFENPDKLKNSTKTMYDLLQYVNECSKKHPSMDNSLHSLMEIMNNLRNTDNYEFNMQFRNLIKGIVEYCDKKFANYSKDRTYWHPRDVNIAEVTDRIRPLSKMQYSLPKYLKRVKKRLEEEINPKKTENISKTQKSTRYTKSIDGGR